MKTFRRRAIVLRRVNYGDADRIIDFITPEGRVSAVAKGVRKQKSKLAGGVELFAVSDVMFGGGRGDMSIVISARMEKFYQNILGDYDRMQFAYEAIGQVASLSSDTDESGWFDMLESVLEALNISSVDIRLIQAWFYVTVADFMGESLNLSYDTDGNKLNQDSKYRYSVAEKGLEAAVNGNIAAGHIKLLRLLTTKSLNTLLQVGGVEEFLNDCLHVARSHAALKQKT